MRISAPKSTAFSLSSLSTYSDGGYSSANAFPANPSLIKHSSEIIQQPGCNKIILYSCPIIDLCKFTMRELLKFALYKIFHYINSFINSLGGNHSNTPTKKITIWFHPVKHPGGEVALLKSERERLTYEQFLSCWGFLSFEHAPGFIRKYLLTSLIITKNNLNSHYDCLSNYDTQFSSQ